MRDPAELRQDSTHPIPAGRVAAIWVCDPGMKLPFAFVARDEAY